MRKRSYDEITIVNNYIYLINNLFLNKEVIVYYGVVRIYSLWMGLDNHEIILPEVETSKLLRSGLFKIESGSGSTDSYVLKDNETLTYILKGYNDKDILPISYVNINIELFEPAIKILRRINNLDKLLYNQ